MTNYKTKKGSAELAKKIEEYFSLCDSANGAVGEKKAAKPIKPYTLSGLLFHLDMSAKELDSLLQVRAPARVISGAKRRIEAYIEENSLNGNLSATAAFNSLKEHFGWSAKESEKDETEGFTVELSDDAERFGA